MREIRNMQEYTNVLIRIVELLKVENLSPTQAEEKELLFMAIENYNSIYQN